MKTILKITSLGASGEGIGSTTEGLKVFVEGVLPDEEVEVFIHTQKKTYAIANLVNVITASSERISPSCPFFGHCGGCQLMHLSYPSQLEAKRKRVEEALKRIGGFKECTVPPCLPSPNPLHYRNKIQLPLVWDGNKKTIGLFRKNSHEIIPIDRCQIQDTFGDQVLSFLTPQLNFPSIRYLLIRTSFSSREALVIFVTDGTQSKQLKVFAQQIVRTYPSIIGVVENINRRIDNVILGEKFTLLAGRDYLEESLGEKRLRFSSASFFQVNPPQAKQLYQTAIAWANIQGHETVIDAYCGVGALALFAADKTPHIYGIECVPGAIEQAKKNAQLNQHVSCQFHLGQAEKILPKLPAADVVFLNPPRKGCDRTLLHYLGNKQPNKILYISCDPSTLARDLNLLSSFGYRLVKVQPFDMFPQTMHVETLVLMEL